LGNRVSKFCKFGLQRDLWERWNCVHIVVVVVVVVVVAVDDDR